MLIGHQSPRLLRKGTEAGGVHWEVERKKRKQPYQSTAEVVAITKCGVVSSLVQRTVGDKAHTGETVFKCLHRINSVTFTFITARFCHEFW